MGISPYQYVLQQRVERAKALLRNSALSIAEIAHQVGFANQSQLTVQFCKFKRIRQSSRLHEHWAERWGASRLDPSGSFGGYKMSGYGREQGWEALEFYLQTKTVWVDLS
jgi:hypothetical protein